MLLNCFDYLRQRVPLCKERHPLVATAKIKKPA